LNTTAVISFSVHFNSHFPGRPRLACTRMSPFWILLELRMMEVVMRTGAIRCAKLQSNRHQQQINTQFLTDQVLFLWPNQQCQSTKGTKYHILHSCVIFMF